MVNTLSTMLPLGTEAPQFRLPDTEGKMVASEDFQDSPALLVVFMCNHCPFVQHVLPEFVRLARDYQSRGVVIVGINSNDIETYPQDGPAAMAELSRNKGLTFPYLFDDSQEVAKAYGAACTPDFYLFDGSRHLVYRGRMDDSSPGNDRPVTGVDLRAALDAVLDGRPVSPDQQPSLGCNIKWKPGNEPEYFSH